MNGLIVDLFAGGGGASTGLAWAMGRDPDIAINHDANPNPAKIVRMDRAAFLAKYYPDLRLTALPGRKVEIRDPQRREGIENFVRAYEQEIWEELLKQATGKE